MFVLDTNVLSALMSAEPPPRVMTWIADRPLDTLYTVAACKGEILAGIALLSQGRRRANLEVAACALFDEDFEDRILPFDSQAAVVYAELFASRRQAGRPIGTIDLIIASVARVNRAAVVSRDIGGFGACGLTLINPWD